MYYLFGFDLCFTQLSQGETTEHQKVNCPNCNTEIDETLNIEAMELANRRILSAQIVSTY